MKYQCPRLKAGAFFLLKSLTAKDLSVEFYCKSL